MENDIAKEMFKTANMYAQAAFELNLSKNNSNIMPSQVFAALSLEIFFKSLYYLEFNTEFKVNNRYSHDFHDLLKNMKQETREDLEFRFKEKLKNRNMSDIKEYRKHGVIIDIEFEKVIENWSSIFVKARYTYELVALVKKTNHFQAVFFPEIVHCLKDAILTKRPQWVQLYGSK